MLITLFPSVRDASGTLVSLSWEDLVQAFSTATATGDKLSLSGWSPARFEGDRRALRGVLGIGAVVLDLDGLGGRGMSDAECADALERARNVGAAWSSGRAFVHSTPSSKDGAWKLRMVFEAAHELDAQGYPHAWASAARVVDGGSGVVDASCKDASRFWFEPTAGCLADAFECAGPARAQRQQPVANVTARPAVRVSKNLGAGPLEDKAPAFDVTQGVTRLLGKLSRMKDGRHQGTYDVCCKIFRFELDAGRELDAAALWPKVEEALLYSYARSGEVPSADKMADRQRQVARAERFVRGQVEREREARAQHAAREAKAAAVAAGTAQWDDGEEDEEWLRHCSAPKLTKHGQVPAIDGKTIKAVIDYHPEMQGLLGVDDRLDGQVRFLRVPVWAPRVRVGEVFGPHHVTPFNTWLDNLVNAALNTTNGMVIANSSIGPERIENMLIRKGESNPYDPFRDYLDGLDRIEPEADGTVRTPLLDSFFSRVFGIENSAYLAKLGRGFMAAAAHRTYTPGYKYDSAPVLVGPQGQGKGRAWKALLPDEMYYAELTLGGDSRNATQLMHQRVLVCMDELRGLGKKDTAELKNFITQDVADERMAYARHVKKYPRRAMLVGTTNIPEFLTQGLEGRRLCPVDTQGHAADVEWIVEHRDALWAEAVSLAESGAPLYWTAEELTELTAAQAENRESDGLEDSIAGVLALRDTVLSERFTGDGSRNVTQLPNKDNAAMAYAGQREGGQLRFVTLTQLAIIHGRPPTDSGFLRRAAQALRDLGWTKGSRSEVKGYRLVKWEPPVTGGVACA